MSTRFRPKRQIICEVCGRPCQTRRRSRDICNTCYLKKEPSALCISCGNMKHLVSKDTGLCPRCAELAARPTGECARCTQFGAIYNQQDRLCKTCAEKARQRMRNESKRYKVACSVCGKMRISVLFGRNICTACYKAELNGRGICARCGKFLVIYHKDKQLCKHCLENDRAPADLRKYIESFTPPYPYNTVLFDLLATSIDWDAVDENRARQFRVFGRFLQTYKFNRPLTWEAIEEALPPLQHARRRRPKWIRSCLLDLGHLLVARGEMESREAYKRRRNALGYIQQAPEYIRPLLLRYAA
jgi:hypothetical protein